MKIFLSILTILILAFITITHTNKTTVAKLEKTSKKELTSYIKAFPWEDYQICHIPDLQANFYVDDLPDSIKSHLRQGIYWEGGIGNIVKTYTKPNSIAIDLGAHIGIHTLTMSRMVGKKGQVIAFEPQKKIFRELIHNMQLNNCKNVIALRNAVGNEHKWIQMEKADPTNEGGTSIGSGGDFAYMITLDSLHLSNVSFIKMDVESSELLVLKGAKNTLIKNKPVIVFEILGEIDLDNCSQENQALYFETTSFLENLGYKVNRIFGNDFIAFPNS